MSNRTSAKTSIEILEERNALHARVEELERALQRIDHEVDHAFRSPDVHFLAMCRIAAVVRGVKLAKCDAQTTSGVQIAS